MKKGLLLIAMVVISYNVFAFTTQGVWRWRNDDGSETSATWRADQNTAITIASVDSVLRLRIELYNNGSGGLLDGAFFEYSEDDGDTWDTIKVTPDADTTAFVLAATSTNVTDLEATTHQLSGQSTGYTFDPGQIILATNALPAHTLATAKTTEYEYVFKPTSKIKPSTTYIFRVDAANYLVGYTYPSLTTAAVLPVNITSFKVQADNDRALITWTTATENNNNRFDVERSNDGKNYKVISTVQGHGTTSLSHDYKAVDTKPMNGVNYYRIKQYDNDGQYQISDVRSVKFVLQNAQINVYPNPTHGDINFTVNNYNGSSIKATLSNVSGKIIHQELINTNTSGNFKLNLRSQLPAGIYMLKLDGSSLSSKLKIVVQ